MYISAQSDYRITISLNKKKRLKASHLFVSVVHWNRFLALITTPSLLSVSPSIVMSQHHHQQHLQHTQQQPQQAQALGSPGSLTQQQSSQAGMMSLSSPLGVVVSAQQKMRLQRIQLERERIQRRQEELMRQVRQSRPSSLGLNGLLLSPGVFTLYLARGILIETKVSFALRKSQQYHTGEPALFSDLQSMSQHCSVYPTPTTRRRLSRET